MPFQWDLSSPTLSTLLLPWANCMDQSMGSLLLWLPVAFIQWGARRWWKWGGEERRLAGYLCPGLICGVTQGFSAFSPEGHSSFALYTACLHVLETSLPWPYSRFHQPKGEAQSFVAFFIPPTPLLIVPLSNSPQITQFDRTFCFLLASLLINLFFI